MQLSEHFSLDELMRSQVALRTGLDNVPNNEQVAHLQRLCELLLEPTRLILAARFDRPVPLHIDSGFRSPLVNAATGGSINSAHMDGRAGDVIPHGVPVLDAFNALRDTDLPYDQMIFECATWIHLALPAPGVAPRREAELASRAPPGDPRRWIYTRVA